MSGEAPNYCLQPTRPPGLTAGWDMSSGLAAEARALGGNYSPAWSGHELLHALYPH